MFVLDVQAIQLMESDDEEENDGFPVEIDKQVSVFDATLGYYNIS